MEEEKLPTVLYYTLADLYTEDEGIMSDTSEDELDMEEIETRILDDIEWNYSLRPESIDISVHDTVGEDTELEVFIEWPSGDNWYTDDWPEDNEIDE